MNYSANYTDENGIVHAVSISEGDSIEALRNDSEVIKHKFDPRYVQIEEVRAASGEAMHFKVTVNAPSHYLSSPNDVSPKECNSMTADVICYIGYPLIAVKVFYSPNHYLASPNVFRSGHACIDEWRVFKSSLVTVVDKIVHDMIHDPNVTLYSSPANSDMILWHKDGVAHGRFPTISPKLLYAREYVSLPTRNTVNKTTKTLPPLPTRRR